MITGSKELIRDINSNLVLETIINSGPISRAMISKKLGLTKATISAIVQDLMDKKLVIEIGSDDTSMGRKPILLSFQKDAGYAISIDLGVNMIYGLRTNLAGEIYTKKHIKTPKAAGNIIQIITEFIKSLIEEHSDTTYGLVGIALGIHGVVNNNKIIFTPYFDLSGIELKKELEDSFKVPTYLENEANLSVLGEKTFMYDYPNIVNISIHSGVGLGIVIDHSLYTGFSGHAGEFGHTIIEINGRKCPCGNCGCLEQYVSERALVQEFAQMKGLENTDFDYLSSSYQNGDQDALTIFNKFIKYMAICVNNVLNTYNPDIVVINSSFITCYPELIKSIEKNLTSHMNNFFRIVPSGLKGNSVLLGGVYVVIKNFLGINILNLKRKNE